ncbi:MAG: sulfotransferase domain-containing protein [Planctomycetota bacterium]
MGYVTARPRDTNGTVERDSPLPARRPDLVAWRDNGHYVVRSRESGESFRLGEEEHFLLARCDGRHRPDEIRADYQTRFRKELSAEDLDEFLGMAGARALLQAGATPGPLQETAGPAGRPSAGKRCAVRCLKVASTVLGWVLWLPSFVMGRIQRRILRLEFVPRPNDVFVVTYPRSGTTWMQMILYQLTTDGEVDFPHISEHCPWFERSVRSSGGFTQRPSPRLFKSHLDYDGIPKGPCKYIYVARDGKDVAVSYYHLYRRYNGYEGTFDEFFELFLKGKVGFGSWFDHVNGWWARRHDENVLFLTYEELSRDLEACVRRIAAFLGREVDQARMDRILERSSFRFMKDHETRFDPALEVLWESGVKLKSFLRQGRVGEGAVRLSEEQRSRFDRAAQRRLTATELRRVRA